MLEIAVRIEDIRDGSERMFTSNQKDIGTELVVARNNVEISMFEISSAVNPHFWEHSNRDLTRVLAVI